jgi:hypothetical protein
MAQQMSKVEALSKTFANIAATFFFHGALALSRVSVDLHRDAKGTQHTNPAFKHLSGLLYHWEITGNNHKQQVYNPRSVKLFI